MSTENEQTFEAIDGHIVETSEHASNETIATLRAEIARLNEVNERLSKIANARLSPLESAVGHTIDQLRETVATHDQELRRWQDEIRDAVIRHSGAPDSRIDGAGCDSGDPLDLSLAEISQGFAWITDKHAETVANVTRERDEAVAAHLRLHTAVANGLSWTTALAQRDAAIIERNDLLAINRGYISDNAQLQSALDAVTRERDAAIADLRTLKEFFDANPNHLANQLRNAIAERDEARTARDLAKGIINPLQREVDSLASQLDQLRREFATLTEWHNDLSDKLQQERARVRELEEKVRDFITARDHHIKDSSSLEHRMALETLRKSL